MAVLDLPRSPWIGRDVGAYRVVDQLGDGGMGMVFLAEHRMLGRLAALKIIRPELSSQSDFVARFRHEAQAIARLDHPGIVRIFDYALHQGTPYLVMEWAPGRDMEQLIEGGRLRPHLVLRLLRRAAEGLDHAHRNGVVHRDLKPSNIRVDRDGQTRLIDFGLACVEGFTLATSPDSFVGSPDYVAPELLSQDEIDPRSDVYSLAAVIFHAVTGRKPFSGSSWIDIAARRLIEPPPEATEVPRGFAHVLATAMSRNPQHRPPGATALLSSLWCALED